MKMKLIFVRNQVIFLCLFSYYCCWTYVQGQVTSLNSAEMKGSSSEIVPSTPAATESVLCNPQNNTGCPKDWFLIYENTCIYISKSPIYYFRFDSADGTCSPFGANYLEEKNLTSELRKCIVYRLSGSYSSSRTIRISNDKILDLKTNDISNLFTDDDYPEAFIVCTINKGVWEAVEIKQFSLQISDSKTGINRTENLLQLNDIFITIEESEDLLTFNCSATGNPAPTVKIVKKQLYSNTEIGSDYKSATGKIYTAGFAHSKIYVCEAVTGFGTQSVEKKVIIKRVRPVKTSPIPEQSTFQEKKVTIKGDQQLQTSTPMQQQQRQQQQHQQQQQESTSSEKTNFLMITLPIVLINIIVIIIFSVFIYINRERLLLKPSSRKAYQDFEKDADRNGSLLIAENSMERLRPDEHKTDTEI